MSIPILATSIAFQPDGSAWLYLPNSFTHAAWWAGQDRPCDRCDSTGDHPHHRMEWHNVDCDCINGRHTFTIDVECSECNGRAEWCGYDRIGNPDCSNGVRSLRVSVKPGMVLPIVDATKREPRPPRYLLCAGSWFLATQGANPVFTPVSLPPDAKPGGWAVQVVTERAVRATSEGGTDA